jgi:DNA polymerase-3 subunit alpha
MVRLQMEREALGFYLSAHPLDSYGSGLERLGVVAMGDLSRHLKQSGRGAIRVAAIAGARKERTGKTGNRYAFIEISDASATMEAVVFSEVLAASRDLLDSGNPLLVTVDARQEGDDDIRLMMQAVEPLDAAVARTVEQLKIYVGEPGPLARVREILDNDPPGQKRVFLVARTPEREIELDLEKRHRLTPDTLMALRGVPGVINVREV